MRTTYCVSRLWIALFAGALALLTACHPEVPQPSPDWVQEKDTTYFKLLWQKPINKRNSYSSLLEPVNVVSTPYGVVLQQVYRNQDSFLICYDPKSGAVKWACKPKYASISDLSYEAGYLVGTTEVETIGTVQATCIDAQTGRIIWEYESVTYGTYPSRIAGVNGYFYQTITQHTGNDFPNSIIVRRTRPNALAWDTIMAYQDTMKVFQTHYVSEPVLWEATNGDSLLMFSVVNLEKPTTSSRKYSLHVGAASLRNRGIAWYTPYVALDGFVRQHPPVPYYTELAVCTPLGVHSLDLSTGKIVEHGYLSDPNDNLTGGFFYPERHSKWPMFVTQSGKIMMVSSLRSMSSFNDFGTVPGIDGPSAEYIAYKGYIVFHSGLTGYLVFLEDNDTETRHYLTSPNTPRYPGARIVSDPVIRNDTLFCSDGYYLMCYKLKL